MRTTVYITASLGNRWNKLLCILRDNNSIIVSWNWGPLIHSIIVWCGKRMAFTDCRFVLRPRTMQLTWCLNLSFGRITVETYCGEGGWSAINTRWLLKYSEILRCDIASPGSRLNLLGWHASRWNFFFVSRRLVILHDAATRRARVSTRV